MRLEKADLMLSIDARRVDIRAHNAEVVPDLSRVDCRCGLGDQFYPPHRLAIPIRGAIESELGSLVAAGIGRVLVVWRQVDIRGYVL